MFVVTRCQCVVSIFDCHQIETLFNRSSLRSTALSLSSTPRTDSTHETHAPRQHTGHSSTPPPPRAQCMAPVMAHPQLMACMYGASEREPGSRSARARQEQHARANRKARLDYPQPCGARPAAGERAGAALWCWMTSTGGDLEARGSVGCTFGAGE